MHTLWKLVTAKAIAGDIQKPDAENGTQRNLLPQGDLQLPEENGWKAASNEVLRDANGSGYDHILHFVKAVVFARVIGVPYKVDLHPECVEWATSDKQVDPEDDEVEDNEGNGRVYQVQKAHRDGSLCEAAVEEQNRDLCCCGRDHVERFKGNGNLASR
jgi:hypothetical protein